MARYVDGFVLPVPKRNLDAYRRQARKAGKIWMEHQRGFVVSDFDELVLRGDAQASKEMFAHYQDFYRWPREDSDKPANRPVFGVEVSTGAALHGTNRAFSHFYADARKGADSTSSA
jgi:hypothetical protein